MYHDLVAIFNCDLGESVMLNYLIPFGLVYIKKLEDPRLFFDFLKICLQSKRAVQDDLLVIAKFIWTISCHVDTKEWWEVFMQSEIAFLDVEKASKRLNARNLDYKAKNALMEITPIRPVYSVNTFD